MSRLGAWWLASCEAHPGEEVLTSVTANRTQSSGRAVGGKLFVTTTRLVFLPHLIDAWLGVQTFAVPAGEVIRVGSRPPGGDTFGGGIVERLEVRLRDGIELFVVSDVQGAIRTLSEHLRLRG